MLTKFSLIVWSGVNATFFSGRVPNPRVVPEMSLFYVSIKRQIARLILNLSNMKYISFNLLARVCVDFVTDFAYKHLRLQMTVSAHSLGDACATKQRKEGLWYWPLDPHDSQNHHFVSLKSEEWLNFLRPVYSEIHFSRNCFNNDVIIFYLPPIYVIFNHYKSIIATAIRGLWRMKMPIVN